MVMKKAWKLAGLGRKNPLKSAWNWYYKKEGNKLNNIKFSIDNEVREINFYEHKLEYAMIKENNKYKLSIYIDDIDYKEIIAYIDKRADIKATFLLMFKRRKKLKGEEKIIINNNFFPRY